MKKLTWKTLLTGAATLGLVFAFGVHNQAPIVHAQNTPPVPSLSGQFILPQVDIQEDFLGQAPGTSARIGEYGWDSTVIVGGTNPVAAIASVLNHPGLITLTTDTTATHGVSVTLGPGFGVLFPGNSTNWQAEWIVSPNQVATGSYRIGFGTVDTATAIPANGIYFRFLQGTDTYINACMDTASSEVVTATSIAPSAADWLHLTMNSSVTGTVIFTVKDVNSGATSTVSLGSAPTVVLSPMFNIAETGSSVADVLTVDYFGYEQQGVTR
jgi:hypothetical protein